MDGVLANARPGDPVSLQKKPAAPAHRRSQQLLQQLQVVQLLFCLMVSPAGVTNVGEMSSGSILVSRRGTIVDTPEGETSAGTVTDSPVGN